MVIDEFAALVAEQPEFIHALVGVAQRGRSLGVHLLLATQRPHGVISDDIRANTDLRIALRLQDQADAMDVVGDRSPATLPRTVPGRAVVRLGADEHVVFQTAQLGRDEMTALVDIVVEAATDSGVESPAAPWLPPLPTRLGHLDIPRDALGLCDDPDHQRRTPLRWSPPDGDVLVVGSPGSGRSSALRLLATQALEHPAAHVYALSAHDRVDLVPHGRPRALSIDVRDRERVSRLLHRLRDVDTPRPGTSPTTLVIDDLEDVRRALDEPDAAAEYDALDAVLANPHLRIVVSAQRAGAVPAPLVARCAHRWVLHLHDPHDAMSLGVAAAAVPAATPGRALVLPEGLEAQLASPGRRPTRHQRADGPAIEPIDPLEPVVDAAILPRGSRGADGDLWSIGLDAATGAPLLLDVPDGEHVIVLGPARSGRSTALTRLATTWRTAHPNGRVLAVVPRRSGFDRSVADECGQRDDVERFVAAAADPRTTSTPCSWSTTPNSWTIRPAGWRPSSPRGAPASRSSPQRVRTRSARHMATGRQSCDAAGSASSPPVATTPTGTCSAWCCRAARRFAHARDWCGWWTGVRRAWPNWRRIRVS